METYDFKNVPLIIKLSADEILNKLSEELIFRYYFREEIKIGKAYCSPFVKDRHPSTWFFRNAKGKLLYYDCRNGEKMDCFGFVKKLYGGTFQEILFRIAKDFGLLEGSVSQVSEKIIWQASKLEKENKEHTLIQFIPDKWNEKNFKFWKQYEFTLDELTSENDIFPVKRLFVNKKEIYNRDNELRYAYTINHLNGQYVKIYSPYSKSMKWISSVPLHIMHGMDDLDVFKYTCIITKSWKDRKVLKRIFRNVVSTQNESIGAFTEENQNTLLSSFRNNIVVYDNDETGKNNSIKLNEKGFGYFNIPNEEKIRFGIKDPADYVKTYSTELLKDLFDKKNIYNI